MEIRELIQNFSIYNAEDLLFNIFAIFPTFIYAFFGLYFILSSFPIPSELSFFNWFVQM